MVIFFPLLISLIGALMYILLDAPPPNNAKLSNLGLHMFWTGLLVFLLSELSRIIGYQHSYGWAPSGGIGLILVIILILFLLGRI